MWSRMWKLWTLMVTAPALALAVPAFAQAGATNASGAGGAAYGRGAAGGASANGAGGAANGARVSTARGILRGTIVGVNYATGVVNLTSGARRYVLQGTPIQVASYWPGMVASVPFSAWGHALWINAPARGSAGGNFAQQITVRGTVVGLNKPGGMLAVRRGNQLMQFRANPNTIQQVVPGELVSLTYRNVGRVSWVSGVRPGGGAANGGASNINAGTGAGAAGNLNGGASGGRGRIP